MRILPAAVFILATTGAAAREPIVGLPCEGCEAVFEGLPAELSARVRIAPQGEPGEPLRLTGRVLAADGSPRAGIVVYAYHTDAQGIYPPMADAPGRAAERHGRLRGWAASDDEGRYTFDTIRPGSYPTRDVPAHIHMHVLEPGCGTYYIDDVMFTDDPLLTPAQRRAHAAGRGGNGIATPTHANGSWQVVRDIRLGAGTPGYRACARPATAGAAPTSAAACAWDASFVSVAATPLPAERFRGIDKTMAIRAIVQRLGRPRATSARACTCSSGTPRMDAASACRLPTPADNPWPSAWSIANSPEPATEAERSRLATPSAKASGRQACERCTEQQQPEYRSRRQRDGRRTRRSALQRHCGGIVGSIEIHKPIWECELQIKNGGRPFREFKFQMTVASLANCQRRLGDHGRGPYVGVVERIIEIHDGEPESLTTVRSTGGKVELVEDRRTKQ